MKPKINKRRTARAFLYVVIYYYYYYTLHVSAYIVHHQVYPNTENLKF